MVPFYTIVEIQRPNLGILSPFGSTSLIGEMRYSGVSNKRGGGGENNRGGWKWLNITVIGGFE